MAAQDEEETRELPVPEVAPTPEAATSELSSPTARGDREPQTEPLDYEDMSRADLLGEEARLTEALNDITAPLYEELAAAGRYELLGRAEDTLVIRGSDTDGKLISLRRDFRADELRRLTLTQDEHPEAYEVYFQLRAVRAALMK